MDNLFMFVPYCVCWTICGKKSNTFRNFLCKLWLVTLPEKWIILRDANSVANCKLLFSKFSWWFVEQIGQKVGVLYILWYQVYRTISSGNQECEELSQFSNVLLSIVLHVPVNNSLQGSYCTFSRYNLGLVHCKVSWVFELCRENCSHVDPNFVGRSFCVILEKMHEPFLWNFLFSFFLRLRFYRTGLDELHDSVHCYYLWLFYQHMRNPYANFDFWI